MLKNEKLQPLPDAVEAATGIRPHLSTVLRWSLRGTSGVRLESTMVGGRRHTSKEAVHRFNEAVTMARSQQLEHVPLVTPKQEERADKASADRLRKRVFKSRKASSRKPTRISTSAVVR